jgi:hypothetical protein
MNNALIPNWIRFAGTVAVLVAALSAARAAQQVNDSFVLRPGWNSIYLEIEPANGDPNVLFNGLPIDSVWTFKERVGSVEFIQDTTEPVWNRSQWLVHMPTNRVESFQNNLFAIQSHRAYLIKIEGSSSVTWTVVGRPIVRPAEWQPNSYNLRGFPIDPSNPPTFVNFFRASTAHYNSATAALEKIYRLGTNGQWGLVAPGDLMRSGEAYWVYTRGGSDFQAPLGLDLASDNMDYGLAVDSITVTFKNVTSAPKNISVRDLHVPSVLSFNQTDTNGVQWIELPEPLVVTNNAAENLNVRMAIRRRDFSSSLYETMLTVQDGAGTRYRIEVSARKNTGDISQLSAFSLPTPQPFSGLWVGEARIGKVNQVNATNQVTPTATKNEFNLRVILHVNTNGQTRLLREVIQLFKPATFTNDANGARVQATARREVLLTDDRLVNQFEGGSLRDGQFVGRRISTTTFDFDASQNNFLTLTGTFGGTNVVSGNIAMSSAFPTNPFRHKYHPDHDNFDATFRNVKQEAYAVARQFELQFSTNAPPGSGLPTADYGYNTIGGTYRETVTGLHKLPLYVQGTFLLQRVSNTGMLNQ